MPGSSRLVATWKNYRNRTPTRTWRQDYKSVSQRSAQDRAGSNSDGCSQAMRTSVARCRLISDKLLARGLSLNLRVRSRRLPAMGLVFALLIQVWMAAAMAGPALNCWGGWSTLAEAMLAAPCCDDHGAGLCAGGDDVSAAPTCASCSDDCGGTASPVVLAQPAGWPPIAAASDPTPVRVTSHLPPAPHRLDRPPSDRLP